MNNSFIVFAIPCAAFIQFYTSMGINALPMPNPQLFPGMRKRTTIVESFDQIDIRKKIELNHIKENRGTGSASHHVSLLIEHPTSCYYAIFGCLFS